MIKKTYIALILIMLLGALLRFWQFGKIPQGFQVDEASFGYNAYSVLKTGRDEYGTFLPLSFRSFNDYKAGGYAYLDIPFITLFGLNEVSVRLPSAVAGVFLIVLVYFVTKKITEHESISLITAFLMAISPPYIYASRIQSEPLLATFLMFLGIYFFFTWSNKKRIVFFILAFSCWIISLFTYQFSRLFFIFFLPLLYYFYQKQIKKAGVKIFIVGAIGIFVCIAALIFSPAGTRYRQVSIFQSPAVRLPLEETIREDATNPAIVTRIFHNKASAYGRFLLNNYFDHFSFDFLFYESQSPVREKIPDTGVLYIIEFPFLLLGIYTILRKKIKWGLFIIGWLLLAPAALSFINDENPNVHRFFSTLLPLNIIVAYGMIDFFEKIKKRKKTYAICLIILPLIFIYSVGYFLHELFVHQPIHQPWFRNYPYKELIADIDELSPQYKKIVFSTTETNTYIYILFYNKYDPKKYQNLGSPGNEDNGHFDKYYFSHNDCPLYTSTKLEATQGEEKTLYVNRGSCQVPPNAIVLKEIKWGDGSMAFRILKLAN